jgi:hypothetical protein
VDALAAKIDDGIAQGLPLLGRARDRVREVLDLVEALDVAVRARAADAGPVTAEVQALLDRASALADRYLALRAAYADAHERAALVLERLAVLEETVPGLTLSRASADALAALDERVRALDADLVRILEAVPQAASRPVAEAITATVARAGAALRATSERIPVAEVRLGELRREVDQRVDRVRTWLTVAAVLWTLAWLYGAFLHVVLFRWAGRRDPPPCAPPAIR